MATSIECGRSSIWHSKIESRSWFLSDSYNRDKHETLIPPWMGGSLLHIGCLVALVPRL